MRQISKLKEGMLVEYKHTQYWICELRGERVRLLPLDAVDFDDMLYDLGRSFEVDSNKVKEVING